MSNADKACEHGEDGPCYDCDVEVGLHAQDSEEITWLRLQLKAAQAREDVLVTALKRALKESSQGGIAHVSQETHDASMQAIWAHEDAKKERR